MKVPKEIRTYCPHCNAHTVHTVKAASKGKRRTLAKGELRHARKLTGHGGKRAGKKDVDKQAKRQVLMLTCTVCKKKHPMVMGARTRKKVEIKK